MDTPLTKISVVIPCRDGAATLGRQLASLARQRVALPWEVIVGDNGSRDATRAVAARFAGVLPDLRVVDAPVPGPAAARNAGAAAATGEALVFCDDDDEVGAGWLAAMVEALARHAFVAGALDYEKLNPPWLRHSRPRMQSADLLAPDAPMLSAGSCNLGIRRRVHDAVGGFDPVMPTGGEDDDYCLRVRAAGWTLRFAPAALVHYRLRRSPRAIFRQARTYAEAEVAVYRRHRPEWLAGHFAPERIRPAWSHVLRAFFRVRSRADLARWCWR